jgi:hypothetical protein
MRLLSTTAIFLVSAVKYWYISKTQRGVEKSRNPGRRKIDPKCFSKVDLVRIKCFS